MPKNSSKFEDVEFSKILTRNLLLPILLGIVSAGLFVFLILNLMKTTYWVEHSEKVIGSAHEIAKLASDMESSMRGYLIANDEAFLMPYRIARPAANNKLTALMKLVADNPPQVQRLKNVQAMLAEWTQYTQQAIELRRDNLDYTSLVKSRRGADQFQAIQNEIQSFTDTEQGLLEERSASSKSASDWIIGLYLAFTLLISVYLWFSNRKDLVKLSANYTKTLTEHDDYSTKLEHQSWLQSGQAKLVEVNLGQFQESDFSHALLNFLADYIGIHLGAVYRVDENATLVRTATYGFSQNALDHHEPIILGKGLLGEAAASGNILRLKDVPNEYFKVNTGLGAISPKGIVLIPIRNHERISGVIELGFLHEVADKEIELLQLLSPNIGTALEITQARQRLQESLKEMQVLNEELQVQQEELRSTNEELDNQSRALEDSQVVLEKQKEELEQSNHKLVEQTELLDVNHQALVESQRLLEIRAADLERASQYKSEFLSNMSHELRTPLNSSLILSKILADNADGNLSQEQVKYANTIYSSGNDLLTLINDILDISKVEAGKLEINAESLSVKKLVESLRMTFSPLAEQRNLELVVNISAASDKKIMSDQQRLQQIIKNLLSNAIKFTESGSVTLEVFNPNEETISFAVQDTGIGISEDDQQRVFEVFTQVDSTINRKYAGSGLGLSISRELAKLLGGDITVSSETGAGSKFTLTVPCHWQPQIPGQKLAISPGIAAKQDESVLTAPYKNPNKTLSTKSSIKRPQQAALPDDRNSLNPSSRTILIVEDDPVFADILYQLGHDLKFQCLLAGNAEDGLSLATEYLPDAVLLDVRLPQQSGLSALQQLKNNPVTRHIPVHVISAEDHTEIALHLGAIGYELKPITKEKLVQIFGKLEEKFTQKIKHVLIVEDDEIQREMLKALIADHDIETTAVATGGEGLALLRSTIFDCMIVDLKLPDMQGNELLEKMATEEICSFPPVIVYTGRDLSKAEELELLKHSRSIIIKGARSPERLLDEVTLFLHKVESTLSASQRKQLNAIRNRERIFEGKKILLVDDDMRNVFALTSALEQKGFMVEVARNGLEAIQKVEEVDGIDLVLMDIMMPEMDGLEATKNIRNNPRFKKLPIIAVTAKATKDDQNQCLAAGTNDYLSKPIDIGRLHSLLRVWLTTID